MRHEGGSGLVVGFVWATPGVDGGHGAVDWHGLVWFGLIWCLEHRCFGGDNTPHVTMGIPLARDITNRQ